MKHVCIVGGGAALATPLATSLACDDHRVTVIRRHRDGEDQYPLRPGYLPRVMECGDYQNEARMEAVFDEVGTIDGLVTLVGTTANAKLERMKLSDWDYVVRANLTTVFVALKYGLPQLRAGGNAVVVGSVVGRTGGRGCANYAASKAGLAGLVRAAANEWADKKVSVNLLELGYINAGMGARLPLDLREKIEQTIPLKRFGAVADFVQTARFLLETQYMTGTTLSLAGGL